MLIVYEKRIIYRILQITIAVAQDIFAYADVTNVIAQQGISQTVTVANVPQIKFEKGSGYYWGNWNLILVYENYKETVKI